MFYRIVCLLIAGALGTLARYGLAGLVQGLTGAGFPWGTLVVNSIGCFLAGLLWTLFEYRLAVAADIRICILVGFLGAFTTFSAFILETSELFRAGQMLFAAGNILLQNLFGLASLFAGIILGRLL